MSTISWGYNEYLYAYGMLLAVAVIVFDPQVKLSSLPHAAIVISAVLVIFLGRLFLPYRMESPVLGNYKMVSSGHYKFVMASTGDFEKLNSIYHISQVAGCKDTYPSVPQAALFGGYIPALRADWKMDVEYPSHVLGSEANKLKSCSIFVERDDRVLGLEGRFESTLVSTDTIKRCSIAFDENFSRLDVTTCSPDPE
jgi:hypothetical protein